MTEQKSRLAIIIDSSGAEKNAGSLSDALSNLTEWGLKAVASAGKVTKATDDEKNAMAKLRAAIDPVGAAIDTVGRRYSELKKYFEKGIIDKEEFDFLSKKLNETTEELSGVAKAQRDVEKAGKMAAAQQEAQAKAFDAMLAKIDPVVYALKNLDQQQRQIYEGAQSVRISLEQYDTYRKKIAEIPIAFGNSIVHEPGGRRIVRTTDFVRELAAINHPWSLKEANRWIEHYQYS